MQQPIADQQTLQYINHQNMATSILLSSREALYHPTLPLMSLASLHYRTNEPESKKDEEGGRSCSTGPL